MSTQINLSKAADQCVMCGMCLPTCPTYQVSQHEAESPRGRISLIKALSEGKLTASSTLNTHVQSCTGCLKCQQICPANVQYQDILDIGKEKLMDEISFSARMLQKATIEVSTHDWGHKLLRFSRHISKLLPIPTQHALLLKHIDVNQPAKTLSKYHQSVVNVFTGCTGNLFDSQTLNSLIKLLDAIGISAHLPDQTLCCGAMAQYSGLIKQAQQNLKTLKHYLNNQTSNVVLSFASGCGRQLNEHFSDKSIQHFDALFWLSQQDAFNTLQFSSTKHKVLIHTPCSENTLQQTQMHETLSRIPNIELIEFDDNLGCCGAGGLQLTSPEQSNQRLLEEKINTVQTIQPDLIVSSNIGCSLNFKLGLDKTNLDIEVIHPLTLLARQLAN